MADVDYPSYLALDELLTLQRPRSQPEHPDELLFIVVHQSSELWFKVIIQQIEAVLDELAAGDADRALWHVQRINSLMRIITDQLSSLDTLPPQRFMQFRGYLGASSGQQSLQFRVVGVLSGFHDETFVNALKVDGEVPAAVSRALARPRPEDLFLQLVAARGRKLEELYLGRGPDLAEAVDLLGDAIPACAARGAHHRPAHRRHGRILRCGVPGAVGAAPVLPQAVGSEGAALWRITPRCSTSPSRSAARHPSGPATRRIRAGGPGPLPRGPA